MSKECTTHHHACDCREEKFRQLEQENAALRADKERYEWLKDGCGSAWAYKYLRNNFRINDDALDAARKEAQP